LKSTKERIIELIYSPEFSEKYDSIKIETFLNTEKFYDAPASTGYHHNYPGGLAEHSLDVVEIAIEAYNGWKNRDIVKDVCIADIIMVGLLHDVGKAIDGYYIKHVSTNNGRVSYSYGPNAKIPHEYISGWLASKNLDISLPVFTAILMHNGLYTGTGSSIMNKHDESQLAYLIHIADMMSARA